MNNQRCPVCGMSINPKISSIYKGKEYQFCCSRCKHKFEDNPEQYI